MKNSRSTWSAAFLMTLFKKGKLVDKVVREFKQSTCETCLPVCLLFLLSRLGIRVKPEEELRILIEGLQFTRIDYAIGQLAYVVRKYGIRVDAYVEFKGFFKELKKLPLPEQLQLFNKKINLRLLKELMKSGPIIAYVDQFYLGHLYHYPHFVVLLALTEFAEIFDPWEGKKRKIPKKRFMEGIRALRSKWKISPKAIQLFAAKAG